MKKLDKGTDDVKEETSSLTAKDVSVTFTGRADEHIADTVLIDVACICDRKAKLGPYRRRRMIQRPNNLATLTAENISQSYLHETLVASNILARHSHEEVRHAIGVYVPQASHGRAQSPIFLGS